MSYLNDTPLFDPNKDTLGREPFGRLMARVIQGAQQSKNTVIGLNGAYGSGKTTAINFAIAYFMAFEKAHIQPFAKDEKVEKDAFEKFQKERSEQEFEALEPKHGSGENETIIIRYNPWLVSGRNALISDFFRLLGNRIAEFTEGDLRDDIRRYAQEVAGRTEKIANGFESLARVTAAIADAAGGSGVSTTALETGRKIGRAFGYSARDVWKNLAEQSETTLQEARTKLIHALKRSGKRLFVIIDDIDRLQLDEVQPVLSMVKSVGDLPGVTYLLAFDRIAVMSALKEDSAEREHPSFLEKIIQVDIDLPRASPLALEKAFLSWLPELLGRDLEEPERKDFEGDFFIYRSMLSTPRDLNRLKNALSFLRAATGQELLITDVVRMELIRLKERELFDWLLRNLKSHRESDVTSLHFTMKDNKNERLEPGLDLVSPRYRKILEKLLKKTFFKFGNATGADKTRPKLGWSLDSEEGWQTYTRLYPHEDTLRREEWEELENIADDEAACQAYLQQLNARTRSDSKTMLYSMVDDLPRCFDPTKPPCGLLAAYLKADEELWDWRNYWGGRQERAFGYLLEFISADERTEFLQKILASPAVPLGIAGQTVNCLGRPYRFVLGYSGEPPEQLTGEDDVKILADIVADRIEKVEPDAVGWSSRIGPLIELYAKCRNEEKASELSSHILDLGGKGAIGLLLLLASLRTGADGQSYGFDTRPNPSLYDYQKLHDFAERALKNGHHRDYEKLLKACLERMTILLTQEKPLEAAEQA